MGGSVGAARRAFSTFLPRALRHHSEEQERQSEAQRLNVGEGIHGSSTVPCVAVGLNANGDGL